MRTAVFDFLAVHYDLTLLCPFCIILSSNMKHRSPALHHHVLPLIQVFSINAVAVVLGFSIDCSHGISDLLGMWQKGSWSFPS